MYVPQRILKAISLTSDKGTGRRLDSLEQRFLSHGCINDYVTLGLATIGWFTHGIQKS